MVLIRELDKTPYSLEDIEKVLEEVNFSFVPPLKEMMFTKANSSSLKDYILKVSNSGTIMVQYNEREIQGVIFFYANDLHNFRAYVPLFAMRPQYRGGMHGYLFMKTVRDIIYERV